jgi:hypothetical protein
MNRAPTKRNGPKGRPLQAGRRGRLVVAVGEFADDVGDEFFGVAEEHESVVEVIQRIVDADGTRGYLRDVATRWFGFRRIGGGGLG